MAIERAARDRVTYACTIGLVKKCAPMFLIINIIYYRHLRQHHANRQHRIMIQPDLKNCCRMLSFRWHDLRRAHRNSLFQVWEMGISSCLFYLYYFIKIKTFLSFVYFLYQNYLILSKQIFYYLQIVDNIGLFCVHFVFSAKFVTESPNSVSSSSDTNSAADAYMAFVPQSTSSPQQDKENQNCTQEQVKIKIFIRKIVVNTHKYI